MSTINTDAYFERKHSDGFFKVEEYELFYRQFGDGDEVLLTLHGGPGMPHDYLAPLGKHGTEDRSVYLYDQFGVGRSSQPSPGDFDRYTVEHYCDEVEQIRQQLDPESFHIYGQSWGGMLALEYLLKYQEHVSSAILANTLADTASAFESMRGMINRLDDETIDLIKQYEAERTYNDPEYLEALDQVYRNHVCRFDEYPRPVAHTFENVNADVYGLMWGPNEYVLLETARLRDWDVRDRLSEISVPTLVLTGSYDEIDPKIAADIADRIPESTLVEFDESSHMPFWEQPDEHYRRVEDHLESVN